MTPYLVAGGLAACVLATPALGQSQVSVTGGVDAYAGTMRNSGDATRRNILGSGGMSTSWFGFRGREDLGGGLRAEFGLAGFYQVDTGASGRVPSDNLLSREASIGLAGPFGKLSLGRTAAPNYLPKVFFNAFGNSMIFSPLMLHSYIPTGVVGARTWTPATAGDTGWSNQVVYATPEIAGLRANFHVQLGEQAGTSGANNVAMNVFYIRGPLALSAFVHRVRASNPNAGMALIDPTRAPINTAAITQQRAAHVGASYDFGPVKLFSTFQRTRDDAAALLPVKELRDSTASAGFSAPAGVGAVLFDCTTTRRGGSLAGAAGKRRTTASLAYDHKLSVRTNLYLIAMTDKVGSLQRGNSLGAGIRHNY